MCWWDVVEGRASTNESARSRGVPTSLPHDGHHTNAHPLPSCTHHALTGHPSIDPGVATTEMRNRLACAGTALARACREADASRIIAFTTRRYIFVAPQGRAPAA